MRKPYHNITLDKVLTEKPSSSNRRTTPGNSDKARSTTTISYPVSAYTRHSATGYW